MSDPYWDKIGKEAEAQRNQEAHSAHRMHQPKRDRELAIAAGRRPKKKRRAKR